MWRDFLAFIQKDSTITGISTHVIELSEFRINSQQFIQRVMQYSNRGSLRHLLQSNYYKFGFPVFAQTKADLLVVLRIYGLKNQNFQNLELTPEIKVCLLLDICSGLQKIQEVLGYHGAINAYNCFLDGNFRVKDSELYIFKDPMIIH